MVERLGGGGGHEGNPSQNLGRIGDHVRELQEQARVSGGIENQGLQGPSLGEGELPGGLIFYPGEVSPRSPPETPGGSQGLPECKEPGGSQCQQQGDQVQGGPLSAKDEAGESEHAPKPMCPPDHITHERVQEASMTWPDLTIEQIIRRLKLEDQRKKIEKKYGWPRGFSFP